MVLLLKHIEVRKHQEDMVINKADMVMVVVVDALHMIMALLTKVLPAVVEGDRPRAGRGAPATERCPARPPRHTTHNANPHPRTGSPRPLPPPW